MRDQTCNKSAVLRRLELELELELELPVDGEVPQLVHLLLLVGGEV